MTFMDAPEKFVAWMSAHAHVDRRYGHVYRYHSRSDAHSIALCTFIMEDVLRRCPVLQEQALRGEVAYGINVRHVWATTQKSKTLDLVIGRPVSPPLGTVNTIASAKVFADIFVACEAKSVMTEHGKSQPRVYDELSSSHEIVHQGRPEAIAAGITVVNIASSFISPLRQTTAGQLIISSHLQPQAAARMVTHLRGLPMRTQVGQVGFDAYCTLVLACDNQTEATLWRDPPAPQPGDPDSYETFIQRITHFYTERFAILS
jgi:hypothetical protein